MIRTKTSASSTNNIQPAMDPLHNCTWSEPRLVPAQPTIYNLLWIHSTTVHDQNQTTASSTNDIQPAMDPLHNCTWSEPPDYCQLNQQYTSCYGSTTQLYMIRTKTSASSTNNIQPAMDPLHNCTWSEPRLLPAQPTIYNLLVLWIHYTTVHDQNQD